MTKAVICTVLATEFERQTQETELTLEVATTRYSQCAAVYVAPRSSKPLAFVCDQYGQGVALADELGRK